MKSSVLESQLNYVVSLTAKYEGKTTNIFPNLILEGSFW